MTQFVKALALSTAFAASTLSATPVQASSESDTIAALLFGAAALYMVIDANDDDKKNKNSSNSSSKHNHKNDNGYKTSKVLPSQCVRSTKDRRSGSRNQNTYMSKKCLQNAGFDNSLPRNCSASYETNNGHRRGYSTSCLMNKGYVIGYAK